MGLRLINILRDHLDESTATCFLNCSFALNLSSYVSIFANPMIYYRVMTSDYTCGKYTKQILVAAYRYK